jgi:hypothetical protein
MTPRNESTLLRMQVDVNKAYDLLNMFKEAGKNRIDIQTILDEAAPKIIGYKKYLKKLADIATRKESCNFSEFAGWLDVSRQTVYNWRDNGYLVHTKSKIDIPATVRLWESLPWLADK